MTYKCITHKQTPVFVSKIVVKIAQYIQIKLNFVTVRYDI